LTGVREQRIDRPPRDRVPQFVNAARSREIRFHHGDVSA
jgi:hypothetical protein